MRHLLILSAIFYVVSQHQRRDVEEEYLGHVKR